MKSGPNSRNTTFMVELGSYGPEIAQRKQTPLENIRFSRFPEINSLRLWNSPLLRPPFTVVRPFKRTLC